MGAHIRYLLALVKRLAGASLLIFANKQDLPGSMSEAQIRDVGVYGQRLFHDF